MRIVNVKQKPVFRVVRRDATIRPMTMEGQGCEFTDGASNTSSDAQHTASDSQLPLLLFILASLSLSPVNRRSVPLALTLCFSGFAACFWLLCWVLYIMP